MQCGAGIPVNPDKSEVVCKFCGAEYDIVKVHPQRVNGHPQFDLTSIFIGAVGGFIIGGIVFTGFGREMAKGAIKRGARLAGIAEERIEEYLRRGEAPPGMRVVGYEATGEPIYGR